MKTVSWVDLFCGAGGTSTGLTQAARKKGVKLELTAINHWDKAIETHSVNHKRVRHLQTNISSIEPRKTFPKGLDGLWASPECTHHSNALGGKPRSEQSRSSAFGVLDWVQALMPKVFGIENVREFINWGPLDKNGKVIKKLKGTIFHAWLNSIKALGYNLQWRIINCADYGDPTERKRFFLLASRIGEVHFPDITHIKKGEMKFSPNLKYWVPAKKVIDFSIPGKSIFNRKKPLVPKTMDRIRHGLKQGSKGNLLDPFLVMMYGTSKSVSLDRPLPTVTASSVHHYLAKPFLVNMSHSKSKPSGMVRCTSRPLPTLVTAEEQALCEPFLIKYYGSSKTASLDSPLPTVTTKDRFGLVQTFGLDVHLRMLKPHELSAGMSFPKSYKFVGNQEEKVKQIGNAVPVKTARALCGQLLDLMLEKERVVA
ncbi:MAG: DNA cytosine methyltransferase [Endozoicomonas sp.]